MRGPGRAAHSSSVYYPLAVVLLPAVAHRPAAPLTADPTVSGASALRRGSDAAPRARHAPPPPHGR